MLLFMLLVCTYLCTYLYIVVEINTIIESEMVQFPMVQWSNYETVIITVDIKNTYHPGIRLALALPSLM